MEIAVSVQKQIGDHGPDQRSRTKITAKQREVNEADKDLDTGWM